MQLSNYAIHKWLLGNESSVFLDADGWKHPPAIGDFKPDLYAQHPLSGLLIIGEAETAESMLQIHAEQQIAAFIIRCAREENAIFVLAVPWYMRAYANAALRRILQSLGVSIQAVVIDELGE